MAQRAPMARRIAAISWGEATLPSSPASCASPQRWSTWPSTEEATRSSLASAWRSKLVSTVTARTSGRGSESVWDASRAPWAAARIMARPPEACTLNMKTPSRTASRAAPSTVFGMSWNLRSRKTSPPRFRTASTAAGPTAVKSCEPILKRRAVPWRASTSAAARSRESTSRATIKRSAGRRSSGARSSGARGIVVLERLHAHLSLEQGLDAADGGLGAVHRRVVGDVLGHRRPADQIGVLAGAAVLGRVEHQRDLVALHEVHDVRAQALVDLVDQLDGHALAHEELGRARRGHEREAHLRQPLGDLEHRALVPVLHGEEHLAGGGQGRVGRDLRLDVGLAEIAIDAHDLARGFHFGAEEDVDPGELDEREDGLLDREVGDLALLREAELPQRSPQHDLGGELGQGHADGLGDERHGARGARVHLEDVDRLVLDGKLDVEKPDHPQLLGEGARLDLDAVDLVVAEGVGRERAGGIARVDPGLLDVLHDAPHDHPLTVCDGVHVDLQSILEKLVHEDGMLG